MLKGAAPEIGGGSGDDGRVILKHSGQQVTAEEGQKEDGASENLGDAPGCEQGFPGPLGLPGAHVLGHDGGEGGHEGHGDDGQEEEELFRDADAGGGHQPQPVDDAGDHEEGDIHQRILQGDGCAYGQDAADGCAGAEVRTGKGEGERMAAQIQDGERHAACLGQDRGPGGTGGSQMGAPHQAQVQHHIDTAGQKHEEQRHPGVSKAAENAADPVIGGHKDHAAAADAKIGHGLLHCVGGDVHPACHGRRKQQQRGGQCSGDCQEKTDLTGHHLGAVLGCAGTHSLADEHRHAHGQPGDDGGDRHHHLTAHGHCRRGSRGGEAAYHRQIYRAVESLQQQGEHQRHGKADERRKNGAGQKSVFMGIGWDHGKNLLTKRKRQQAYTC